MSLPNLPVEIWHKILQECISIPKVLDVNQIQEFSGLFKAGYSIFNREYLDGYTLYEETEYRRNVLQRVCKAWDEFLRRFEHRYVQILDIYHGCIPTSALEKAIRIRYTQCPDMADCDSCSGYSDEKERLRRLLVDADRLSVEILDGGNCETVMRQVLSESYGQINMPDLKVILNTSMGFRKGFGAGSGSDSRMLYGWMNLLHRFRKIKWVHLFHFESQHLEFLDNGNISMVKSAAHLEDHGEDGDNSENVSISGQSSLQPLSHGLDSIMKEQILGILLFIPLFQLIGYRLRSLDAGSFYVYPKIMPREILELCPNLERLGSNICLRHPPPLNHPLHLITIFLPFSMPHALSLPSGYDKLVSPLPSSLEEWTSLRRIIVATKWVDLKGSEAVVLEEVSRWGSICEERGIALVDNDGKLFGTNRPEKLEIV
jgi:hypothetical protein